MRNPWRMQDGPDNKINRNNFPMSFQYNGTFKYGKIYPIGLIRTIPGASYQIDSTLALNFMPTSFPIQTRQRAYVHFFYGRDRNFWKDYKDFVNGMNPDLVKPYLDTSVTKPRTGSLLDYLGVPTTLVGSYANFNYDAELITNNENPYVGTLNTNVFCNPSIYDLTSLHKSDVLSGINAQYPDRYTYINWNISSDFITNKATSAVLDLVPIESSLPNNQLVDDYLADDKGSGLFQNYKIWHIIVTRGNDIIYDFTPKSFGNNGKLYYDINIDFDNYNLDELQAYVVCAPYMTKNSNPFDNFNERSNVGGNKSQSFYHLPTILGVSKLSYSALVKEVGEVKDIDDTTSPYWRSGSTADLRKRIKLNAIPCRMYETIYNLYYRNPQNNPYILNGKPEYNVFIPTKDGGVDSNLYELRYRNWEDDFLTTAVQTPQQGIAPLVGLTDRGATVTLTNEDGSVTRYKTNLDENGNVTGIETTDSSEPLLTQALLDAVSYGISIEDLRNVNAMQKWLELNLRKGYQYKDIIEARWGISISYNELDLPEFIGGFTQEVGLQAVTQTTSHGEGIEGALGWQAGRMYASGSGRSITHYCEEEGYIMALLCVVPVPNYSQLLPKHWFTRDLLDSYQPEFNHIGFQPITYKEVCPIQAYQESTDNVDVLEQTFGYQRPWYEYFNQVDEVHGQFRTDFKDFLINRTFDVKPELSESFLLVDPNQVNDVFAVTTDDDKIIGAIEHRITAKLPISLYAQARLE